MASLGRVAALGYMLIVAGLVMTANTVTAQESAKNATTPLSTNSSNANSSSTEISTVSATTTNGTIAIESSSSSSSSESSFSTTDLLPTTPSTASNVADAASSAQSSSDSIQPTLASTEPASTAAPSESSGYSAAIEPSSTVAVEPSQSVYLPDNDTSANTNATAAPADAQPAAGGGGDTSSGELSTGGKVAIGIFVSLAVVALIVGGVCFYQRTNDPKGTLKNLVNPGIQYRSFDSTGGKEESSVTMR